MLRWGKQRKWFWEGCCSSSAVQVLAVRRKITSVADSSLFCFCKFLFPLRFGHSMLPLDIRTEH